MDLVRLSSDAQLGGFDCGDEDLNNFLIEDALRFHEGRLANSFILEENGSIAAYFCLLNDKISKQDVTNSQWRKIKDRFPQGKKFSSYPAVKIGRFAVSKAYKGKKIGTMLMNLVKDTLLHNQNYSAFRFLTVDAYHSAIPFYEKNGFEMLTKKEENDHTRLMYFDMRTFD